MLRPRRFLQAFWGGGCGSLEPVAVPGVAGERPGDSGAPRAGAVGHGDPALEEPGFGGEGEALLRLNLAMPR